MSSPVFLAHIVRPPFALDFPPEGGLAVTFPVGGQAGYPPVCVDLAAEEFTITFPPESRADFPKKVISGIILNNKPFELPGAESGRLVLSFPSGGKLRVPSKSPAREAGQPFIIKATGTGIGIETGASMDPLP